MRMFCLLVEAVPVDAHTVAVVELAGCFTSKMLICPLAL
jgi:hypothetical protein